jgi:hypothetical protein
VVVARRQQQQLLAASGTAELGAKWRVATRTRRSTAAGIMGSWLQVVLQEAAFAQ